MGVGTGESGMLVAARDAAPARQEARTPTAAELAWIVLLPWAIVTVLAIQLVGPPLGDLIAKPDPAGLWPPTWWEARGFPEPAKHGRFAIAMLAPALLVAGVLLGARRAPRLPPAAIRAATWAGQLLVAALVVVAILGQHEKVFVLIPMPSVFSVGRLVLAGALVAAALAALQVAGVQAWVARVVRETPRRRLALLALVVLIVAAAVLRGVSTDGLEEDVGRFNWTINDVFAVLDGRTPLVDYSPVYGKLLPYPTALVLLAAGDTAFVFTATMAVLNALALLAVYAILRRVTRSSAAGLVLFAPFLALTATPIPISPFVMTAMWPMRYGGSFLVAWLTVRQLDGAWPRRPWIVFFVGGLIAINTVEFGAAAILATLAALLCARPPRAPRELLPLAAHAAGGVLGAVALVWLFTLVRSGELPRLDVMLEYPRLFTNFGWFSMPMPRASLHLAIYATFVAAVAVAAVRVARGARDTLLTSMVAWSGVFGLVASAYFISRPDDFKLISMFGAWAFALVLLTAVAVSGLAARAWRRPTLADVVVLLGFALAATSIHYLPLPHDELARLTRSTPPPSYRATAKAFVRTHTPGDAPVVILLPEGHRIAYELGLDNVAPYPMQNALVTRAQLDRVIHVAQREGVHELFVPAIDVRVASEGDSAPEQLDALAAAGWTVRDEAKPGLLVLSDR